MSDEHQVKELVAKAIAWSGRLDIWVNNAAKFVFGAATTATDAGKPSMYYATASDDTCVLAADRIAHTHVHLSISARSADWNLALGVNIKGYAFGIKHASLAMIKQKEARCSKLAPDETAVLDLGHSIVNVSSISAFMAQPGFVPYSSTKAAINEMTRCCALDLGKHCIR